MKEAPRRRKTVTSSLNEISTDQLEFLKQSLGTRKIGIGSSYRPARLHRLAELIPWNRILGSLK
ncbi:MAG: hypothetical protein ACK55I_51220, partial [bacterium]